MNFDAPVTSHERARVKPRVPRETQKRPQQSADVPKYPPSKQEYYSGRVKDQRRPEKAEPPEKVAVSPEVTSHYDATVQKYADKTEHAKYAAWTAIQQLRNEITRFSDGKKKLKTDNPEAKLNVLRRIREDLLGLQAEVMQNLMNDGRGQKTKEDVYISIRSIENALHEAADIQAQRDKIKNFEPSASPWVAHARQKETLPQGPVNAYTERAKLLNPATPQQQPKKSLWSRISSIFK